MLSAPLPPCSILLLAGGRGSRMGGRDKGLVPWRGRPMIAWLHQVVRSHTDDLILSCNRNEERYQQYADRLVRDGEPGFPGPMAGIRAGLAIARHPWLLVLPCDAPLVDTALLLALRQASQATGHPLMLRQGEQWEPLFCMIPTTLCAAFEQAWMAGERSNLRVLLNLGGQSLAVPAGDPRLANLNTPALMADITLQSPETALPDEKKPDKPL
ncbi:molybdenum cofactor guanylyltransferase MobA [Stutzerimonas tarimensis]|uniref:Molybdenum cofactor guanylyltransferase n=1 Tax=Stutzerimonas tarimensis TaxID=1507735 RepID=A0ABV7T2M7_9GAMM